MNHIITTSNGVRKILLISFLFLLAFSLMPLQAQAVPLVTCGLTPNDPCEFCDIFVMVNGILKFLLLPPTGIVFIIATLLLTAGGVLFFFGGAKPEMLTRAKGIITSVVIGLVVIFTAWILINTIITKTGIVQSPDILRWYKIDCQ